MKRVVSFLDTYDEIPDNSKYLYSRKIEVPLDETHEQKTARIISNDPDSKVSAPMIIYMHYYEVNSMDFEELMEGGFAKDATEKIKDFVHKYKLLIK
jgi:hypothetical protein